MDDKKFKLTDQNGNIVECEIIKVVPNNEEPDKPYIIYTDFIPEHEILCGMLIEENGYYTVNKIEEDYIVDYLKDELSDELIKEVERLKEVNNE